MSDTQTTMMAVLRAYLDELMEAGIPDPMAEAFTLGAVLDDLARLAGLAEAWPWPGADRAALTTINAD